MKKILFIATIPSFINAFLTSNISILHEMGYEVHIAVGKEGDIITNIPSYVVIHYLSIQRSPLKLKGNYKAYKELLQLIKQEKINLIDCHTPVGGVLGRLIAKKLKVKCIYTAHGFHFFKGAPLKNWIIFYPIEKYLSKYTDVLITINKEDYKRAKNKFKMKQLEYIPGVGINLKKFVFSIDIRERKRTELNILDEVMLLSVGELCSRKNHKAIIDVLKRVRHLSFKYFIVGEGVLYDELQEYICSVGLDDKVFLLGLRNDISALCNAADIFLFPSIQEGLPVALMESIACKCPVIVSDIRGNRDLVENDAYRFSIKGGEKKLLNLLVKSISQYNRDNWAEEIEKNYARLQSFSEEIVKKKMMCLYKEV